MAALEQLDVIFVSGDMLARNIPCTTLPYELFFKKPSLFNCAMKNVTAATNIIYIVPPPLHVTNLLPVQLPFHFIIHITIMRPVMTYLSQRAMLLVSPMLRCAVMNLQTYV